MKILWGVALLSATAALILVIIGVFVSQKSGIEWEVAKTRYAIMRVVGKEHCGYAVFVEENPQEVNCTRIVEGMSAVAPDNHSALLSKCEDAFVLPDEERSMRLVARVLVEDDSGRVVLGEYHVKSALADIWLIGWCQATDATLMGIVDALGFLLVAAILFCIALVLCCVGLCCGAGGPPVGQVSFGAMPAVGQAVASQGHVVMGSPVTS
eukprot:CAMPEP_0176215316 /NCGR_PEP_ID=MMETSP0121_2-20121125/16617_1 /TAXON_ID=160619 /ORGANISM="Kryptoperidinium foliaceum, Strain CCMP 1326" /LENGTH=209 /DNA_ID=CAMNT_0017554417 /DNA_START=74 /DNA_END=703 /DNA_ORIENTATION=-